MEQERGFWFAHGFQLSRVVPPQVVLTFLFSLSTRLPTGVLVFAICCAAFVYLYSYLVYLPYYHQFMNQVTVAYASVFTWAAFCLVLAYVRNRPAVRSPLTLLLVFLFSIFPHVMACCVTAG